MEENKPKDIEVKHEKETITLRRKFFTAQVVAECPAAKWNNPVYKRDLQVLMLQKLERLVREANRMLAGECRWLPPVDIGGGNVKLVLKSRCVNSPTKWKKK